MKILALADRKISENLPELIHQHQIQLVVLLGDLKYIEISDLADITIPIIGVLGNHCKFNYFPAFNGQNAHGTKINLLGYSFVEYQGCPHYKGGEYESTQEDCSLIMESLPKADFLLAHSPAQGINSAQPPHEGFVGLTTYLDRHSPKFFSMATRIHL